MAFGGGEWVKIVNSVLNIKSTNQVQQSVTCPSYMPYTDSEIVFESILPGRAAKRE